VILELLANESVAVSEFGGAIGDIAVNDAPAFTALAEKAKAAL